jgi:hypothetical protein
MRSALGSPAVLITTAAIVVAGLAPKLVLLPLFVSRDLIVFRELVAVMTIAALIGNLCVIASFASMLQSGNRFKVIRSPAAGFLTEMMDLYPLRKETEEKEIRGAMEAHGLPTKVHQRVAARCGDGALPDPTALFIKSSAGHPTLEPEAIRFRSFHIRLSLIALKHISRLDKGYGLP